MSEISYAVRQILEQPFCLRKSADLQFKKDSALLLGRIPMLSVTERAVHGASMSPIPASAEFSEFVGSLTLRRPECVFSAHTVDGPGARDFSRTGVWTLPLNTPGDANGVQSYQPGAKPQEQASE